MRTDQIDATNLITARVFVVQSDPNQLLLRMTGADNEDRNFLLTRDAFKRLAKRLSQDAALLTAEDKTPS